MTPNSRKRRRQYNRRDSSEGVDRATYEGHNTIHMAGAKGDISAQNTASSGIRTGETVLAFQTDGLPFILGRERRIPRRLRAVIPAPAVTSEPYYVTTWSGGIATVGGPFSPEDFAAISPESYVINFSKAVNDWYLTSRADARIFHYHEPADLATPIIHSSFIVATSYKGGGLWYNFGTTAQSISSTTDTNTFGGSITVPPGEFTDTKLTYFQSLPSGTQQVGNFDRTQFRYELRGLTEPIVTGQYDFNRTANINGFEIFERVDKNGLFREFQPFIRADSTVETNARTFDRNTGNYSELGSAVESLSQSSTGNITLYGSLSTLKESIVTTTRTDSYNRSRTAGTVFNQDDLVVKNKTITTNKKTPRVIIAAADGSGCLYMVENQFDQTQTLESEKIFGTVDALVVEHFPTMRTPTMASSIVAQVVGYSLAEQGSNGGWVNGGSNPNQPGLACPINIDIELDDRVSAFPGDRFSILNYTYNEFDAPGAYLDNFTNPNNNVFCKYALTLCPPTNKISQGGKVSGIGTGFGTNNPQVQTGNDGPGYYPAMNITQEDRKTVTRTTRNTDDFYVWVEATATSYKIENLDPDNRFIFHGINPDINLVPGIRGEIKINEGSFLDLMILRDPWIEIQVDVDNLDRTWTDPTSGVETTNVPTDTRTYTTQRNLFFDGLIGKPLMIIDHRASLRHRYQATITALTIVDTPITESHTGTFVYQGAGEPRFKRLRGITAEITGDTALIGDWDAEFSQVVTPGVSCYLAEMTNFSYSTGWPAPQMATLVIAEKGDSLGKMTLGPHPGLLGFQDGGMLNATDVYELVKTGAATAMVRKNLAQNKSYRTIDTGKAITQPLSISQWPD